MNISLIKKISRIKTKEIDLGTRVQSSAKDYDRNKEKKIVRQEIEEELMDKKYKNYFDF